MRNYLSMYRASKSRPPLSRRLSARIASRDWACSAVSIGTLLLECALVPATLVAPAAWRFGIGACGMIALHCGIGLVMSGLITWVVIIKSSLGLATTLIGFRVGEILRERVSQNRFRQIVLVAFLLMGMRLIAVGLL